MRSGERDLVPQNWQETVKLAMGRQNLSNRKLVIEARKLGLKISGATLSQAMHGNIPPHDRVVAAYSLVLGIHPDLLGFERKPLTELAYRAFEAMFPDALMSGRRTAKAA